MEGWLLAAQCLAEVGLKCPRCVVVSGNVRMTPDPGMVSAPPRVTLPPSLCSLFLGRLCSSLYVVVCLYVLFLLTITDHCVRSCSDNTSGRAQLRLPTEWRWSSVESGGGGGVPVHSPPGGWSPVQPYSGGGGLYCTRSSSAAVLCALHTGYLISDDRLTSPSPSDVIWEVSSCLK